MAEVCLRLHLHKLDLNNIEMIVLLHPQGLIDIPTRKYKKITQIVLSRYVSCLVSSRYINETKNFGASSKFLHCTVNISDSSSILAFPSLLILRICL